MARYGILTATKEAPTVPQFGAVGIHEQPEVGGRVAEPSLDQGRHVPLLEPHGLVDVLGIHGETDIRLRQRNVVWTTPSGRPAIDADVGEARRRRDIRVESDD